MNKAKHSPSLARNGLAVSQTQEPEGTRTLLRSICGSPRPRFLCQGFCLRGESGPWFLSDFFHLLFVGKKTAASQEYWGQCSSRAHAGQCHEGDSRTAEMTPPSAAQEEHATSEQKLQAKGKLLSHTAWRRMDVFNPLPSVLDFDSLLCPFTPSLSSAIVRQPF